LPKLKAKKENTNLRELFRRKLENSEVTPSGSVRKELMRKLAVREFLRFNPSVFNIYYAGAIVVTSLAAYLILSSAPQVSQNERDKPRMETLKSTDSISITKSEKQVFVDKPSVNSAMVKRTSEKRALKKSVSESDIKSIDNKIIDTKADKALIKPDTLKKKAVFPDKLSENNNKVSLQKTIAAAFTASLTSGCSPVKVKFLNRSTSFDSCRWVFGDGGFSNEKNPEWIFDVEGEYKIVLKVFNSNGAQATATSEIIVHPRPVARFEIAPEKPVIPDDVIRFVNYSTDAVRYRWEFGDGNNSNAFEPDHKYRIFSKYNVRLIAWSEFGCTDSMLVNNAFAGSGCFINFPNAFIPGSDGPSSGYYSTKSDEAARIFHPVTSGVNEFHLKIFSKQGILIFESNDINIGWDGYLKGQLCEPGVYIWKVRGTFSNGEPFVKMGDITLLKN
jgi:PKD repeat protein